MANYVLDHTGQQVNTKLTKAENIDNKVTSLSSSSTDTQYPSAKLTYDQLTLKQNKNPDGTHALIDNSTGKINTTYIPDSLLGQIVFGGIINNISTSPDSGDGESRIAEYVIITLSTTAKSILNTSNDTVNIYPNNQLSLSNMFFITNAGNFGFADLNFNDGDWLILLNESWQKIDNTDSVTSVNGKVGNITLKTSDLQNDSGYLTSHQDISGKENTSNKVTSLSSSSTDTQYPSAKLVYDQLALKADVGAASAIDITDTTPDSATSYYLTYVTNRATNQTLRANADLYYYDAGSSSYFNIGSSSNMGGITLHQNNGKYTNLVPATGLSANNTLTLPTESGTLALTSNYGNAKIYYGTCSTAADVAEKQVVCSAYTATGNPTKGDIIYVTFSYTNSVAAGTAKLKVGNSTAKVIRYQGTTSVANLPGANYLIANNTYRFTYNGTYWVVMLNYNSNTNTLQSVYIDNTNVDLPIAGLSSTTKGESSTPTVPPFTSGTSPYNYTSCYGAVPNNSDLRATINLSTGKLTVPGGIQIGTSSTDPLAYTTNIYGTVDIINLDIEGNIIPVDEGCKLGDDGWEWDTIYSLNYIGSAQLNGTPTAPTAAAGTNTTQIATTAFVKTAIDNTIGVIENGSY